MIKSFARLLIRCYRLAIPYGRLKLFAVLFLIFFNGVLQLVGVTSVFPFFALAADPERIRNSLFGQWFLHFMPPLDNNHLLVVTGCLSILMLFIASIGSLFSEVIRFHYAFGFSDWLRGRVLQSYATQPYSFYLKRNSADLNQRVLDIQGFTQYVMLPIGEALTRSILIILLVGGICVIQPWIALGAALLLGGFYLSVFSWIRPRTRNVAEGLQIHNTGMAKRIHELLHGMKSIMVHEKSRHFTELAMIHSRQISRLQTTVPVFTNGPRYMIEPVAFGGLVAVVVILALQGRPFSDILPNLSVMALAGLRLLPALQLLYGQLVIMTANHYTLNQLEEEISDMEQELPGGCAALANTRELDFHDQVRFENVCFRYDNSSIPLINNLSLTIRKNESIGIAGPSGSGKSTIVDLLIGLHLPTSGRILVDECQLGPETMRAWHRLIGYVPQDIFLLDDTVAANIAFGVDDSEIDHSALLDAARGAQILEFIENELPAGFLSKVGERGVRLSGGQRQRIGLARALYHRPQILILDEATSALDQNTEQAVMKTIHQLQGTMTMIIVAHRLSTLERCDRIVKLKRSESGQIESGGIPPTTP